MIGRTNTGGGGGGLNLKVIAYPTESALLASAPMEGTLGVITSTPITANVFAASEPKSLLDGAVWFLTGTNSLAAFNVSKNKKEEVFVYPISAKQSVGGVLVVVVAKSYIGGKWVDWWNGELYDSGNEYTDITGGWVDSSNNNTGANIEYTASSLKLTTAKHGVKASVSTKNLIDMTNYSTLVLTGEIKSGTTDCGWGIWDANGTQVAFARTEYSIDISALSGMFRPFLQVKNGYTYEYIIMSKMQMV